MNFSRSYSPHFDCAETQPHSNNSSTAYSQAQALQGPYKGCAEVNTKGILTGSPPGTEDRNTSRVSTAELVDFTKEQAKRRPIKEVARLTGLSLKAVESIRSGEAAASGTTISTWCKNCPEFRTEYFRWVGGYMETDPEFVKGITMALQSLARRGVT